MVCTSLHICVLSDTHDRTLNRKMFQEKGKKADKRVTESPFCVTA